MEKQLQYLCLMFCCFFFLDLETPFTEKEKTFKHSNKEFWNDYTHTVKFEKIWARICPSLLHYKFISFFFLKHSHISNERKKTLKTPCISILYDSKLYLVVRLQFLNCEECRANLPCHYSQVHDHQELGSCLWIKEVFKNHFFFIGMLEIM